MGVLTVDFSKSDFCPSEIMPPPIRKGTEVIHNDKAMYYDGRNWIELKPHENIYETVWIARDLSKEYPHGFGFTPPLVSFSNDLDIQKCIKLVKSQLSNDEFECIGIVPKKLVKITV